MRPRIKTNNTMHQKKSQRFLGGFIAIVAVLLVMLPAQKASAEIECDPVAAPPVSTAAIQEYLVSAEGCASGIMTDASGNVWTTVINRSVGEFTGTTTLLKRTPSGAVSSYILNGMVFSIYATTSMLTMDSRGDIWFIELEISGENLLTKINKFSPTLGEVTEEHTVATTDNSSFFYPLSVAAAPDGTIWFTGSDMDSAGVVGKLNPLTDGVATYSITDSYVPTGIGVSVNGTAWLTATTLFGDTQQGELIKVMPNGAMTNYPLNSFYSYVLGNPIVLDTQGNIWIAGMNYNTESGVLLKLSAGTGTVLAQYPTPTAAVLPTSVVLGNDGMIWFNELNTEDGSSRLGKLNPITGVRNEYDSIAGFASGMVSNADGTVWFLKVNDNKIGRFTIPNYRQLSVPDSSQLVELTTPDGTVLTCVNTLASTALEQQDPGKKYPLGLVNFCLNAPVGSSQQINLTFTTDLTPDEVTPRKYNPTTKAYGAVPGATVSETTQGGRHALRLTYVIVDGGSLDSDGLANGVILDPVGLATTKTTPFSDKNSAGGLADTGERTLSIAGPAAFLLLVASGSVLIKQRRRRFIGR